MATATQKEMLHAAKKVDGQARERMTRLVDAVKDAADELDSALPGIPVHQLVLDESDADPFNGNLNNRRVAARIARRIEVTSGDPIQAKKDVEKSLKINPEPQIKSGDELPEIKLVGGREVTPGSPADLKHGKSQTQLGGSAPTGEQAQDATTKGQTPPQEKATGTEGKAASKPPQWKAGK